MPISRPTSLVRLSCSVLALALAIACEPPDTAAPPLPWLEALPEVTSLPSVWVEGSAEYAAAIELNRDPAFAADEAPAPVRADPITGRFRLQMPLAAGVKNSLAVIARDAAGNASAAATGVVLHEVPRPQRVRLSLLATVIDSDEGRVVVNVEIGHRQPEVVLEGLEVKLEVKDYGLEIASVTMTSNAAGHAQGVLAGLTASGSGTLVATAVVAGPDGVAASDAARFAVVGGRPRLIALELSAAPATGPLGPSPALSVPAGTDVDVSVKVTDAHGNVLDAAPLRLSTDAPGARATGARLTGLETAGIFHVFGEVSDTLVATSATLTVTPAAARSLRLALSSAEVGAGTLVALRAEVVDAFGNVTGDAPTLATTAPEGLSGGETVAGVITATIATRKAGSYTVTATSGALAAAEQPLLVHPAAAAHLALTVQPASGGTPAATVDVAAGTDVHYATAITDAFDNPVEGLSADVRTDAGGATVSGGVLTGLVKAGAYRLFAQVGSSALAAQAAVTVRPAAARTIDLRAPSEIVAGLSLTGTARALDAFGNVTGDALVLASTLPVFRPGQPGEDAQQWTAVATLAGVTEGTLTPKTAGAFTLRATFGQLPAATLPLVVRPAAAASFSLSLDTANAPFSAAEVVAFHWTLTDAFGNATGTPVSVTVNAPGALVTADLQGSGEIQGIVRAGAYVVQARAIGTIFTDSENLVVEPDPGQGFNLYLSSPLLVEGGRVLVFVQDAFGNAIDLAKVTLTVNDVAAPLTNGRELAFPTPGTFAVKAVLSGSNPVVSDTELVVVQGVADTLPPTASISSVVFPQGTDVAPRGWISARLTLNDDRSLAEGELQAQFGDATNCTASSGRLVLVGETSVVNTQVSLRAPTCAMPLDRVRLVVRVTDQAGNMGFSPTNTTLRLASLPGFDIASSGYATTVVAFGNRIRQGDRPTDVAVDPGSETAYVSLRNNNRVIVVFPDHTQDNLKDLFGQTFDFNQPEGVAVPLAGDVFVGDTGAQRIDMVPRTLVTVQRGVIAQGGANPGRLNVEESAAVPLLCSAWPSNNSVRCHKNFSSTPVEAVSVTGLTNPVAADIAPGAIDRLWILESNCRIRTATLTYSGGTVTAAAPVIVVTLSGSTACRDLVALPSGAVAVVDATQQRVVQVTATGAVTQIASGQDVQGIDFANGRLYVIDAQLQALFAVSGSF